MLGGRQGHLLLYPDHPEKARQQSLPGRTISLTRAHVYLKSRGKNSVKRGTRYYLYSTQAGRDTTGIQYFV